MQRNNLLEMAWRKKKKKNSLRSCEWRMKLANWCRSLLIVSLCVHLVVETLIPTGSKQYQSRKYNKYCEPAEKTGDTFYMAGNHRLPQKKLNKLTRILNGNINGIPRNIITVVHWNMGANFWQKKIEEIEAVILQYRPDIFIISESNLLVELKDYERDITGYTILLPLTTQLHMIARLVILVRDGLQVEVKKSSWTLK